MFRNRELTMPIRELDALSTADLWTLRRMIAQLLVDRIARRSRELDALIARLTPRSRSARKVSDGRRFLLQLDSRLGTRAEFDS